MGGDQEAAKAESFSKQSELNSKISSKQKEKDEAKTGHERDKIDKEIAELKAKRGAEKEYQKRVDNADLFDEDGDVRDEKVGEFKNIREQISRDLENFEKMSGGVMSFSEFKNTRDKVDKKVESEKHQEMLDSGYSYYEHYPVGGPRYESAFDVKWKDDVMNEDDVTKKKNERLEAVIDQKKMDKESKAIAEAQGQATERVGDLLSTGGKSVADVTEHTNSILQKEGIDINSKAAGKIKDSMIEAFQVAELAKSMGSDFGGNSSAVAKDVLGGTSSDAAAEKYGFNKSQVSKY
jgi:hypothetical protein